MKTNNNYFCSLVGKYEWEHEASTAVVATTETDAATASTDAYADGPRKAG